MGRVVPLYPRRLAGTGPVPPDGTAHGNRRAGPVDLCLGDREAPGVTGELAAVSGPWRPERRPPVRLDRGGRIVFARLSGGHLERDHPAVHGPGGGGVWGGTSDPAPDAGHGDRLRRSGDSGGLEPDSLHRPGSVRRGNLVV